MSIDEIPVKVNVVEMFKGMLDNMSLDKMSVHKWLLMRCLKAS
jgi:hypothetical protein